MSDFPSILGIIAAVSAAVTAGLFRYFYPKKPGSVPEMLYIPPATPLPEAPVEPLAPIVTPEPVKVPPQPKYLWETAKQAYHSTRLICDEMGLTVEQKNILCACVFQESRFKNYSSPGIPTKNVNHFKDGSISTDFGIVQVNDYWNIGKGKPFPSVQYVMENPEKVIRWMVKIYKTTGRLQPWASYTSGAYKQWLPASSPMWTLKS